MESRKRIPMIISVVAALTAPQAFGGQEDQGRFQLAHSMSSSPPPMMPPPAMTPPAMTPSAPHIPAAPRSSLWGSPDADDITVPRGTAQLPYTREDAQTVNRWMAWDAAMKSSAWNALTNVTNTVDWVGWGAQEGLNFIPGGSAFTLPLDTARGFAEGAAEAWSEGKPLTKVLTAGLYKGAVTAALDVGVGKTAMGKDAEKMVEEGAKRWLDGYVITGGLETSKAIASTIADNLGKESGETANGDAVESKAMANEVGGEQ